MKYLAIKFFSLLLISVAFLGGANHFGNSVRRELAPQDSSKKSVLRSQKNEAFKRGEKLKYRMHYGFINAGEVSIQVMDENKLIGGRKNFHLVGLGYTNSSFDWMFLIRDRYESYIDEDAIVPWLFIRRVNEGGYSIIQNQIYNHYRNTMEMDGKKFDIPEKSEGITSAFSYAGTIGFSNGKPRRDFFFP